MNLTRMVGLLGLAAACAEPEQLRPVEAARQEVMSSAMGTGYELSTGTGALATGALFVPRLRYDGTPVLIPGTGLQSRATCGVTFVSPHYAITAAHCVAARDVPHPETQTFTVETYDLSTMSPRFRLPTALSGFFPNYTRTPLTAADGYRVSAFQCSVEIRCGAGNYRCPPQLATGGDTALLRCPERPATEEFPYVAVAQADPMSGPVELYWAHEVLDVPPAALPPKSPADERDRHEHYVLYNPFTVDDGPGAHLDNFHYHPNNQLLPLRSVPFSRGVERQRLGPYNDGVQSVATDLFGCHGTSGSGVMQRSGGVLELLGPARSARLGWQYPPVTGAALLCMDPAQQASGTQHLTYTENLQTRTLDAEAQSDRDWVAWLRAVQG